MSPVGKVVLGTVQFGLKYGISHTGDVVSLEEAGKILQLAWASGIRELDTAVVYGESEEVLGRLAEAANFRIISKTRPMREHLAGDASKVEDEFAASLRKLRRPNIEILLVHNVTDLLGPSGQALWSVLENLKARGCVRRLGVSTYDISEAEAVLRRYPIQVVQLPVNVFDQRGLESGGISRLTDRGVAVHARSVLLQGLLVMDPNSLPDSLSFALEPLKRWRKACEFAGVTPLAGALSFAATLPVDALVLGVQSADQLASCIGALANPVTLPWSAFRSSDVRLIDPRSWSIESGTKR